jgi:hypothetical protein
MLPDPDSEKRQRSTFPLSNGEIYFLWWFIRGSVMSPSTREETFLVFFSMLGLDIDKR